MGRRNKTYSKDLHQQAYDRLTGMLAFGESKKEAMATGTAKNKIFSHATYKNYWKHIKYFLGYIKEKHPECTTLKNAKKYVNEWLQSRVDQGLSAWTVQRRQRRWESCTGSLRMTRHTLTRRKETGRILNEAAETGCGTNTSQRRTMMN